MDNFQYECSFNDIPIGTRDIEAILPNWKTRINEIFFFKQTGLFEINFCIAAKTVSDVKQWLKEYENKNKCNYSIRSSEACTGVKVQFKQRLNCQHNTTSKDVYNPATSSKIQKNTNCPSYIILSLRTLKKKYHGKNKSMLDPDMLCHIRLLPVHNHEVGSADALTFRKVSEETKAKIIKLYECGHTPVTALEALKTEIKLNHDNAEILLADRHYCPDYIYCYRLYKKYIMKHSQPLRKFLIERRDYYNAKNANSMALQFRGQDYAICICTPLMKRVHSHFKSAGELVFIDSTSVDNDQNRVFLLLTYSECGGIPLAVFITSSKNVDLITMAFSLLKELLGDSVFGGKLEGPDIFLTDDTLSEPEQAAIKTTWSNSTPLLCIFHVLQSIWLWLVNSENGIPTEKRTSFFQEFKAIMYAQTTNECKLNYLKSLENSKQFPAYEKYLQKYWNCKQLWALPHRAYNTNKLLEAAMCLVKEEISAKIKSLDLKQIIDFICDEFTGHYENKLSDVAQNPVGKCIFGNRIEDPPPDVLHKIQTLNHDLFVVPSGSESNIAYIVNMKIVFCTCNNYGRSGKLCQHIEWTFLYNNKKFENLESASVDYYFIATGENPPAETDSCDKIEESITIDNCTREEEVIMIVTEDCVEHGQNLIEEIAARFREFLNVSPNEVATSLENLNMQLKRIKTVEEFNSCCSSFASENNKNGKNKSEKYNAKRKLETLNILVESVQENTELVEIIQFNK